MRRKALAALLMMLMPLTIWAQPTDITSLGDITNMAGNYRLTADVSGAGHTTIAGPFTGTLEAAIDPTTHMPYRITDLDAPLFATLSGTVKNLVLDNVNISGHTGNTGAIACEASGAARIYNVGILSGSVGGTGNTGGLVGYLDGTARVVNSYSYANITAGTNVGGIVGYNNQNTTAASINTMVMNCMFYGDITGGTTVSPVFGGTNIANLNSGGLNTFNYYAYDELQTKAISNNKYNSALAVEEKFLKRHEFYRLLLNSNKKLAAFYVTGNVADANLMLKWVLETADRSIDNPKPYPILKAQGYYPSIINPDFANAPDSATVGRNHGGKVGRTLSVTISSAQTTGGQTKPTGATITTSSLTLQRTDKDFDRFNYNYDKVQLPYYNDVGTGNYTDNRVVTGWKITAITAVPGDPYTSANYPTSGIRDFPDHNYADRRSSNKDLYSVSGRVFSQGAYFDVPYGVTSITIEPYWGKAHYIADPNFDVVYKTDYKNENKQNVSQTGTQVANPTGATPTLFNGQKVETSIERALNNINNNMGGWGSTVYDNALVLVGNLHLATVPQNGTTHFTMMSVDEDNDHEPDYSLIYHHIGRSSITPIRFDFLNIPGTAQAQKPNGASLICNFTIFKTRGWFEVTNTALLYTSQLEYENLDNNTKTDAPLILQGGVVDQFVSTQSKTVTGKTIYIHVGGNVWIKEFGMGTHSDGNESTPHVPVSVTGGEFPGFYLTGTYKADAKVRTDNAECYISGGYIHEAAGAALEQIDGNVRWQIYNADIDNFFGGGINDAKPIKGNITTEIYNSHVTLFCGGPKFGNMQANKKVTTRAEGCVFGTYFGAGYGGTSLAKKKYYDLDTYNWNTLQGYYTADRGKYFDGSTTPSSQNSGKDYGKKGPGVATDFDYEFFVWSSGKTGARFFVKFAAFSLAQCHKVSSSLKKCTVDSNFYGGGSLGKVVDSVTSVLDSCIVKGNVFGAGFSASLPTIQVRDGGFTQNPNYNSASGMFEPGIFTGTTEYHWKQVNSLSNNTVGISTSGDTNYVHTTVDLNSLGAVEGNATLTLNATTVGTLVAGNLVDGTGNVYGGGEESKVQDSTIVTITGASLVYGNVFGAGKGKDTDTNMARVGGSCTVTLDGADARVLHNIYGGGELSMVNGNTQVNIVAGKVGATDDPASTDGFVFGGGKGNISNPLFANVKGNTHVTMSGGTVHNTLFGGGELASVGTFTLAEMADAVNDIVVGEPISCADGTGRCLVEISGGQVGHKDATLLHDIGYVFGAGMGVYTDPHAVGAGGLVYSVDNARFGYVNTAHVVISDDAFIVGAVWGGSEDGQVLDSCGVVVTGGQIGCGYDWENGVGLAPYTSTQWTNAINAVKTQNATDINSMAAEMPECHHWPYGRPVLDGNGDPVLDGQGNPVLHYLPYDPYASAYHATDASEQAGDGHTFFGNVFGGGSGYYAYLTDDGAGGYTAEWYRFQGRVRGNSYVEISGGHILTSVYGGCEYADVMGDSRVVMTGGTLGVPRTLDSIRDHPVTAYLFGAGKGDQRTEFNLLTNVQNARVTVTGGVIFGSVFGGSEDGNTLGDAKVNIGGDAWIGTWGTSYVDGNIFGAGRGFSGVSQTSGSVGGNVQVNVSDGRILGSIFGGGRMASVGTYFAAVGEANYGVLKPDDGLNHYGEIRVNITGGTIGNGAYRANPVESTWTGHIVSGNVFGGGMGRYDKENFIWPMLGRAKRTFVTVNGATVNIQGNVYGGGEIGCVEEDAAVEVQAGTVFGSVYGGGFGSRDDEEVSTVLGTLSAATLAGRVEGNTTVAVSGGWVKENVYGGGEIATVGHITDSVKHSDADHSFYLSWPYRMTYADGTGNTAVSITGGRIGISGKDAMEGTGAERIDNGDVYGAGKGLASSRYHEAHLSNVNNSSVTINFTYNDYATPEEIAAAPSNHQLIAGSVYGGAENGHVIGNTSVTLTNGLVGHNIYGGGKGKGEYLQTKLKHLTAGDDGAGHSWAQDDDSTAMIYSVTAGRVYGNTHIVMNNGHVIRNIFGGGNQGSVGVGNFAGGGDDYSANGYGEKVDGNERPDGLTDADEEYYYNYWDDTVNRGRCIVEVLGGTVGTPGGLKDDLPTGNVFGACRGQAPRQVEPTLTNRWWYVPEYYLGYVNTSYVTIGTAGAGPTIYGSVYGGAQDGHVRNSTTVIVNNGTIGLEPTDANKTAVTTADLADLRWSARGNVFGAGSGIGLYDSDKDGVADSYNNSSGSVTKFTTVTINGGTIHQNVYGGGNLGTVGQPCINCGGVLPTKAQSLSKVTIGDNVGTLTATIGSTTGLAASYGGNVYGSSRGMLKASDEASDLTFANTTYTQVDIRPGAVVRGSIFGGGENGFVRRGTEVNVTGGTVGVDVYGGGQGAYKQTIGLVTYNHDENSGRVGENTEVNIFGGTVNGSVYGGAKASYVLGGTAVNIGYDNAGTGVGNATIVGEVFGANNLAGTPRGNTTVHVYSTAHSGTNAFPTGIAALAAPDDELTIEDLTINMATQTYALSAVYGGGNLAAHDPTAADGTTLVHVHYCDQNTIKNIYGGGNAADTKNNHIIIEGGRIENVFGGGNGYSATNNHENPAAPNYNPGANVNGTARTEIHGGIVDNIFGGSNTRGEVRGTSSVNFDPDDVSPCPLINSDVFGGGNHAESNGNIEVTIPCGVKLTNVYGCGNEANFTGNVTLNVEGGVIDTVFGGAKNATIDGNITVNYTGGYVKELFGGNNKGGNITGTITVNVDVDPDYSCPDGLALTTVYGGGKDAAYTPHDCFRFSPTVNIMNNRYKPMAGDSAFVEIENVYGGGFGATAKTVSYPRVTVGGFADRSASITRGVRVYNTVYGGGYGAPVYGNTTTLVRGSTIIGRDDASTGMVFGGGYGTTAIIHGGTYVGVFGLSEIKSNVYGGGNAGAVLGNTDVQIGYIEQVLPVEILAVMEEGVVYATLVCSTPGVSIRYTLDGTTPTTETGTEYSTRFPFSWEHTIKAIAYKEGMIPSVISFDEAPTPTIEIDGTTVTLDAYVGARIYYTKDGTDPTISSSLYGTVGESDGLPFTITSGEVVKAMAVMRGCVNSKVGYLTAEPPTVTLVGDDCTITSPAGTRIIYTTDGSNPSSTMGGGTAHGIPAGTNSVTINNVSNGTTIKAIVEQDGYMPSNISAARYTAAP